MEREDNGSLILVMVNQGYTDEVMNTARAAGARGGTIIRSRFAGGGGEICTVLRCRRRRRLLPSWRCGRAAT